MPETESDTMTHEQILAQKRNYKYYQTHRDSILNNIGKICQCACGMSISYGAMYNHKRTKRHTRLLMNQPK
jgi:hypothetical protein